MGQCSGSIATCVERGYITIVHLKIIQLQENTSVSNVLLQSDHIFCLLILVMSQFLLALFFCYSKIVLIFFIMILTVFTASISISFCLCCS